MSGYLYLATNPFIRPDLVKIGRTDRPLRYRIKSLSNTSFPGTFAIAHSWLVRDSVKAESLVHAHFASARIDARREFFELPDQDTAIATVTSIIEQHGLVSNTPPSITPVERAQALRLPKNLHRTSLKLPTIFSIRDVMDLFDMEDEEDAGIVAAAIGSYAGSAYPLNSREHLFLRSGVYDTSSIVKMFQILLKSPVIVGDAAALKRGGWGTLPPGAPLKQKWTIFYEAGSFIHVDTPDFILRTIPPSQFAAFWKASPPSRVGYETLRFMPPELALAQMLQDNVRAQDFLVPRILKQADAIDRFLHAADLVGMPRDEMIGHLKQAPLLAEMIRDHETQIIPSP